MADSCTKAPEQAAANDLVGGATNVEETADSTAPGKSEVSQAEAIEWLEQEFAGWSITVSTTSGWNGTRRDLWEAHQILHHSQRAMTAGRLYRRLDEYEQRHRDRAHLASKVL
ncbi:MAG: hypothetical protein ACI867_001435 [Glaciecola sp.]|jgi:hypothetical protein